MEHIEIFIPGKIANVTHQSGTRYRSGGFTYKTKPLQLWEAYLSVSLKNHVPSEPLEGPIQLEVDFRYKSPRKADLWSWRTKRPDTDNMIKTIKDVMTRLGFWGDDSQIAFEICKKLYVDEPGIRIIVNQLTEKAEESEWKKSTQPKA